MVNVEDCCEILDSMRVPITASERKEGKYPYYGANGIQDYVDDYNVYVKKSDGTIVRNSTVWSEYYFYDMPKTLSVSFSGLDEGENYTVEIYANSFWKTCTEKPLTSDVISL